MIDVCLLKSKARKHLRIKSLYGFLLTFFGEFNKQSTTLEWDVFEINELNLRLLRLSVIHSGEVTLIFKNPFEIEPLFDEQAQEVVFRIPELNIIAAGPTREEAVQQVEDDLVWLWSEYAETPEESLSLDARDLKKHLQSLVKEVKRA